MRCLPALLLALVLAGCVPTSTLNPDQALDDLARLERAWLDAYDTGDREAMGQILAPGFTITFPGGRVDTRDDVLDGLTPNDAPTGPSHFTEDRSIRILGTTAILTGVYVNPGGEGTPDTRMRYTDTWMLLDGRWQVVASHLSTLGPAP
ncbi:MAG: nuclear transport factor 2 family protein [Rubricoccaceae bacterium]|nr:nuclear transport factor 2 family protein [Rubricoccaceae bacterium]